jgi:hypothetical protein
MELIYSKLVNSATANSNVAAAANTSLSSQALLSNAANSIFLQSAQKYHNGHGNSNNTHSHHHNHHHSNHAHANIKFINSNRLVSPLLMLNGSTDVNQDEIANELINSQRHSHHNNLHLGSTYEDDYEEEENELNIGGQQKPQKQKPKNNMTMTSAIINSSNANGNGLVKHTHNFIEHEDSCDSSIVGDLASVTSATDDNDLFMIQTINSSLTDLAATAGSLSIAITNRQQQLNLNRRDNHIHSSHYHHHHHHHHNHHDNSATFDDNPSGNNTSSNLIEDLLLNAANTSDNLTFNGSDVAAGDSENKFDLLYSKSINEGCVKSLGAHKNVAINSHDDEQTNGGPELDDSELNFANTILINSNHKNVHIRFGACNGESEDDASQDLISTELLLPEQNAKKFNESNGSDLDIGLIGRSNDGSNYNRHENGQLSNNQSEIVDAFVVCKNTTGRENYKHNSSSESRSQTIEQPLSMLPFGIVSVGSSSASASSLTSRSSSNSSVSCSSSSGLSNNYLNSHQTELVNSLSSNQPNSSQAKCFISQKQISIQNKTSINKISSQIGKKEVISPVPLSLSSSSLSPSSSGYEVVNSIDLKSQTPRQQPQQMKPKSKKKSSPSSISQSVVDSMHSTVLTNEKVNCKPTNNSSINIQQNGNLIKTSKSYSKPSTIASLVNMNGNNSNIINNNQQSNASIINNSPISLSNNSLNSNKRQRIIQPLTSKITQQLIDFQNSNSASSAHFQLNVLCTGKCFFFKLKY